MFKVVIVDDEEIIRSSLRTMIPWAELDCAVVSVAQNGVEAYQQVADTYPDIIITDMKMPLMDGLELIEKVHALDTSVEFIVLSGYGEFSLAQKAMRYGVKHYLLKPTKKEDLMEIIRLVIEEIKAKREKKRQDYVKLLQAHSFFFQKSILLEVLNNPTAIKASLGRNIALSRLKKIENVCLLGVQTEAAHCRSLVMDTYNYCRMKETELLFVPVFANNTAYFLLHIDNILIADLFRQHFTQLQQNVQVFMAGTFLDVFTNFIHKISGCKEIQIFDPVGRSEYLSNTSGFTRKITTLCGLITSGIQAGEDIRAPLEELNHLLDKCTLDEAKTIFLTLVTALQLGSEDENSADYVLSLITTSVSTGDIVAHINRLFQHRLSVANNGEGSYPVKTIKKYIENNISSENISLKWIAENILFMNVGYLSKLFVREVGVKFSDYVNRLKINSAKHLIAIYHESTIQEIAQEVGFGNSPQYFSQVFRKYEGITPSEYLRKVKTKKKEEL